MLSNFSVKKPYTVIVAVVLALILGVVSFTSMTVDLLPDINLPYAVIVTTYPGANPEMVEAVVTRPVEQSMATVSNISNITSTSSENASTVVLEFTQTANMDSVTLEMREKIDQIKGYWPDEVANPMIMKINPNMMPIMAVAIGSDNQEVTEVSTWVEDEVLPSLESVEGVASVTATGTVEQTVEILINADKIDAQNEEVKDALAGTFEEAEGELNDAESEIVSGQNQLDSGANELVKQKAALDAALLELEAKEAELESEYEAAIKAAEDGAVQALDAIPEIQMLKETMDTMEARIAEIGQLIAELSVDSEGNAAEIEALVTEGATLGAQLLGMQTEYNNAIEEAKTKAREAVDAQFATIREGLKEGKAELEKGKSAMDAATIQATIEIAAGKAGLSIAKQEIEAGQKQLEESKETALEGADVEKMITAEMINGILTAQNFSMPAGYLEEGKTTYLVRIGDKFESLEDIQNMPLFDMGIDGLDTILLSDVAEVSYTSNADEVYARVNGEPGVMLNIQKQTGYSTGDVSKSVTERLEEIRKENKDAEVAVLMDQGDYIDLILNSVLQNMIYGSILAILILMVFLRSIQSTIVIGVSIPISIIVALVLMYFSDISLNIISLSGLALGIGMLVDNSIVVIENIYRMRNEEKASITEAAIKGAQQVAGAIMASTLTTVCVFLPIVFIEGITRQLFVDMGLTIAYSLLASLVVALTVVPVMLSGMLKKDEMKESKIFYKLQDGYGAILERTLKLKVLVIVGAFVLLGLSAFLALKNGFLFMPEMESTQITMTLTTEKGTELAETSAEADKYMKEIEDISDIESIGAMLSSGNAMGMSSGGSTNKVDFYAILGTERTMSNEELQKELEKLAENINGEISINMSTMDMSALGSSGVVVQIKGKELDTLQTVAEDMAVIVEGVDGTKDVSNGMEESDEEMRVVVDKEKAAEKGLTVAQVFQEINGELAETTSISTLSTDSQDFPINVVDAKQKSLTREDIQTFTITVDKKDGTTEDVKLSDIATFESASGLQSINRDSQTRTISVTAGIEDGSNISLVAEDVEKAIEKYDMPEGYTYEMVGEDETIMESVVELMKMLGLAVVFMYLIMVAQFQSLRSPFIIMFTVPLAFTGGLFALWITNKEVSTIALIGFVMLSGIIVNNGIVLVDYTNQLIEAGVEKRVALIQAGKTRLRSIIMTALTTILGLSTMAIGIGMGSDMVQPMAIVTVGGLLYGTVLTLFVVPCIYDMFHGKERKLPTVKKKEQDNVETE